MLFSITSLWSEKKENAPEVVAILEKMTEATGGADTIQSLKSLKTTSSAEMVGMGMKMNITTISGENCAKLVTKMNGKVMMEQAYDGEIAWSKDMMMGTRVLSGAEALAVKQATLENTIDATGFYDEIKVGKEKVFNGEKVIVLLCDKEGMDTSELYVGKDDYLLKGMLATQESPQGKMKSEIICEAYKTSKSGMVYLSKSTIKMGPISMNIVVDSYSENIDLKEVSFKKP